jgi:very-short-patch-repair endonuclease
MTYLEIRDFARRLRNSQTPYEKILWHKLRFRQVEGYKFLRQHPVMFDRKGNDYNFFILDFYCAEAKIVIEVDGGIHKDQVEYDKWRQHILESMEIKFLRFQNREIDNIDAVLGKIRQFLHDSRV